MYVENYVCLGRFSSPKGRPAGKPIFLKKNVPNIENIKDQARKVMQKSGLNIQMELWDVQICKKLSETNNRKV